MKPPIGKVAERRAAEERAEKAISGLNPLHATPHIAARNQRLTISRGSLADKKWSYPIRTGARKT